MINLSLSLPKSMSLRIICMLFFIPSCVFSTNELYRRCSQTFNCGDQSGLLYPFWIPGREECGHPEFKLVCNTSTAEVSFSSVKFRLLEENYISGRIRLARSDFINNLCPRAPLNVSFVDNVLPFAPNTELLTIYYGCNFSREVYTVGGVFYCPNFKSIDNNRNYFVTRNLSSPLLKEFNSSLNELRRFCLRNVTVPASGPSLIKLQTISSEENLGRALRDGFELGPNQECVMCIGSKGACGYNQSSSGFICYPPTGSYGHCRQSFTCGNQNDLFYPFWIPDRENCGHPDFKLECNTGFAEFNISSVKFRILEANSTSRVIRLARSDFISNLCPQNPPNALFNQSILPFAPDTELLPIYYRSIYYRSIYYRCQNISLPNYAGEFDCGDFGRKGYYVTRNLSFPLPPETDPLLNEFCNSNVSIPVSGPSLNTLKNNLDKDNLKKALEEGFEVGLNQECLMCMDSGGACGYDQTQTQTASRFICYCKDEPRNHTCSYPNKGLPTRAKEGIGAASALMGVILIVAGLFCVIRCQKKTSDYLRQQNLKALNPLKHYSYSQLKRITKSFVEVVGKGGFGTVYRGTLSDGHNVAVKILKDSKGNGEDFINEVASMSKTSHVNIVSLLGFCSEGSKRAIIYEYLENGSLDQFISSNNSMNVDWMALYGIALGVARGLEYLHHGCKTRIVHFDIKPQNILLDDNLCPKVSDFGLAKLCEKKESILSLLDTRGTIGYIAPEVFSRMYGRVSHKSDVYSYGMLVLEMIGARNKERFDKNSTSNTSTIYFPEWIYKDLEKRDSGRLIEDGISNEDAELTKKMTMVGLWCIQPSPSDRPAMNRVVEMMEGNLDALEVPPRPVLHIPPVPLQESSTFSEDISVYTEE